jgi:hypothetical protein
MAYNIDDISSETDEICEKLKDILFYDIKDSLISMRIRL